MHQTYQQEGFTISTDPQKLVIPAIHQYLSLESYWAKNIPVTIVEKAIQNSLNFGLYLGGKQIGYARVVSDFAVFAYLCDVFILKEYQGKGLGKWLMKCIMAHPDLQGLRRFMLMTKDAHGLYAQFGFTALANPGNGMEITKPDLYKNL